MTEKYKFEGVGLTKSQLGWAKKKFKEYQDNYEIDKSSDLSLLEELVYRESLQNETKEKIAQLQQNENIKEKNLIPASLTEFLDENLNQIIQLKEKLGLFSEKENQDAYSYIEMLQKKFQRYLKENQGSRTLTCPHCAKMIMLVIRTEAWEALKHPFFQDKILSCKPLWEAYKSGQPLTKETVAKILGTSPDYVDWLEEKIYKTK